jgi:NTP pyrophosphatase (non-canonical NTP hydrolase)
MITIEKCPCGYKGCSDYHLVGIGTFVQGSGFTKREAETIANLLNRKTEVLDLAELIGTQARLQARMGEPTGTGEAGVKESLLHVMVETVEALREINFKPWKTTRFEVNREALATELTDILQFWANAAIAMGFTAEELTAALRGKWNVNHQRIDDGDVVENKS